MKLQKQPPEVFCVKGVLRNFTKFTGKRLCQSLFPNKIAGLRPAILLKKRHWRSCFLVNFCEISKNIFFIEHLWLLLLSFLARSFFFKAMKLDALALWGKKIYEGNLLKLIHTKKWRKQLHGVFPNYVFPRCLKEQRYRQVFMILVDLYSKFNMCMASMRLDEDLIYD